ncbi:colicin V secretion/processing ATP-binding protein CvaB [Xanthomonas oryzae pv. oryzicola]|nr:colicin V secretion/processing ATP-binding protein CvaB [Xanthomonas oryzae pv. oryzicola]
MKAIVQAEASECGLASLAMVASAHGMQLDLPELRRQFHLSLKGIRLNQLIEIAQTLGFSTRPLRLEMEQLDQLSLPCILHWDLNHFVVLAKVGKSKATIFDPAIGERRLSLSEVSRHFTGVALELTPTAEFKQHKAAPSISARQLTGPIRGLWSALSQIALLSMALQIFVILAPFYTQWVVDQVLVSADRDLLVVLGLGFGLALLLQVGIGLLRGWSVVSLLPARIAVDGQCVRAPAQVAAGLFRKAAPGGCHVTHVLGADHSTHAHHQLRRGHDRWRDGDGDAGADAGL